MPFDFPASSPPSTPDRRLNGGSKSFFGDNDPSTTPAGPPPPSSAGSYTPAGPPPSSFLNSSTFSQNTPSFGAAKPSTRNTFNQPAPQFFQGSGAAPSPSGLFGKVTKPAVRSGLSQEFLRSTTSEFPDIAQDEADAEGEDYDDYEKRQSLYQSRGNGGGDDRQMIEDDRSEDYYEDEYARHAHFNSSGPLPQPTKARFDASRGSDLIQQSVGGGGQSLGQSYMTDFRKSVDTPKFQRPEEPLYGKIARDMSSRMGIAELSESDIIILQTEEIISRFYTQGISDEANNDEFEKALVAIPDELVAMWVEQEEGVRVPQLSEYASAIGPGSRASKFSDAQFLASLLLRLHHPNFTETVEQGSLSTSRSLRLHDAPNKLRTVPAMLLEWMYENHEPAPSQLNDVRNYEPSPSAHPFFWETILNGLVRGKLYATITILKSAGWETSRTTVEDGVTDFESTGYRGQALSNIKNVIEEAIQTLSQCPAMENDWDIRSSDWTLFRLRASQSLENLKIFAEGRNRDPSDPRTITGKSLSATARKAQSQVPWNIYQRLSTLYNIMLGDSFAIIESSQDWLEATIGLVIWWDPNKDERRLAFGQSTRLNENVPEQYFDRVAEAFYVATEMSTDFQVNTMSIAEVGLAIIFEGEVQTAIQLVEACSVPLAAALVEIASLGGWLPKSESQNLINMDSLDQDDLDVLGLSAPVTKSEDIKDDVLSSYAADLMQKHQMLYENGNRLVSREGWELAIEVLGRLNSVEKSETQINNLLDGFPLDSSSMIDKLWTLLNYLGMSNQAEKITEKYADSLADSTHKYGEALWYYALSHNTKKVKDVLNLLVSFSLINSTPWPPTSDLDSHLKDLIVSPATSLAKLSKLDLEAAQILHKMLSGYATLRTFYTLRDAESSSASNASKLHPNARKLQAVASLMAVLASSDDNIRGGLYDESRGAVVSVDFLFALLGEAMVFVNTSDSVLTLPQIYTLLKTIEDLQGVSERIYNDCEAFLQTVIASTPGLKGSSPMDLLKKSASSLGGAGSFSLVGSSMVASQLQRSMSGTSMGALAAKSEGIRGWDWRGGLEAGMKGTDLLAILRFGLAKELSRAWMKDA